MRGTFTAFGALLLHTALYIVIKYPLQTKGGSHV
mgnify:CR=1 FL=1